MQSDLLSECLLVIIYPNAPTHTCVLGREEGRGGSGKTVEGAQHFSLSTAKATGSFSDLLSGENFGECWRHPGPHLSEIPHQCAGFLMPEKGARGVLVVWAMGSSCARPLLSPFQHWAVFPAEHQ